MRNGRTRQSRRVVERWNEVFRGVSAEPRRQLIVALMDAGPGATVALPESAMNPGISIDPDVLEIGLRHQHLPALADKEFIEWEDDPLRATRGPRFDEIAAVFEALHAAAGAVPDSLVQGCRRLEAER